VAVRMREEHGAVCLNEVDGAQSITMEGYQDAIDATLSGRSAG
jgi:hypothetical protein